MRFGFPKAIVSDRGSAFRCDLFKNLAHFAGYDLKPTTAYHPQTNGLVEREHRNLKQYMRAYCMRDQKQWDLYLSSFTFACNSICKVSYPPAFLVYGVYPRLPALSLEKRYFIQNMDEYVASTTLRSWFARRRRQEKPKKRSHMMHIVLRWTSREEMLYGDRHPDRGSVGPLGSLRSRGQDHMK